MVMDDIDESYQQRRTDRNSQSDYEALGCILHTENEEKRFRTYDESRADYDVLFDLVENKKYRGI